jgi:hypothetical protein
MGRRSCALACVEWIGPIGQFPSMYKVIEGLSMGFSPVQMFQLILAAHEELAAESGRRSRPFFDLLFLFVQK